MIKAGAKIKVTAIFAGEPGEVRIYRNGNLYHVRKFKGREIVFKTIVPGNYTIYPEPAQIRTTADATAGAVEKLPPPDRNAGKKVTIRINPNLTGTPARIFPATGIIEVGADFHKLPEQAKLFILLHELGHLYYSQEKDADHFALTAFNHLGGNPSQSVYTLMSFLSDTPDNRARINSLFNKAKHL